MKSAFAALVAPHSSCARDVLAFVLCPASVFVESGDALEIQAAAEIIAPAKQAAARQFLARERLKQRN